MRTLALLAVITASLAAPYAAAQEIIYSGTLRGELVAVSYTHLTLPTNREV